MNKKYLNLFVFLLAVVPVMSAYPVDTATNTKTVPAELKAIGSIKQGLDTKITYEARRKTISAVLEDLSSMSGVQLRAGLSKKDWQVRDRKVYIFAKEQPLSALMASISRVLKFKWRKSESEQGVIYRLYQDRNEMNALMMKQAEEDERIREKQKELREAALDKLHAVSEYSEADLEQLKEEDPYLYFLNETGVAKSLDQFLTSSPEARDAFINGQGLSISSSDLSDESKDALVQVIRDLWSEENVLSKNSFHAQPILPDDMLPQLQDKIAININSDGNELNNASLGRVSFTVPGNHLGSSVICKELRADLCRSDSIKAKFFGNCGIAALEHPGTPFIKLQEDILAANGIPTPEEVQKDLGLDEMGDPIDKKEPDPALDVTVDIPKDAKKPLTYETVNAIIADTTSFAIVCDSFGKPAKCRFSLVKTTVNKILENARLDLNSNWWRVGNVIELRERMWLKKRSLQIPEEWLDRWRADLKDSDGLSLDTVADICTLSQPQYDANIACDEVLGRSSAIGRNYMINKDDLGFYARLDPRSKKQLTTSEGLDINQLPFELRTFAYKFIWDANLLKPVCDDTGYVVKLSRISDECTSIDGRPVYRFIFCGADGLEKILSQVNL
ncbi:MAG: hypothetical protein ABFD64_09670 [Armatimonadota bacterium]